MGNVSNIEGWSNDNCWSNDGCRTVEDCAEAGCVLRPKFVLNNLRANSDATMDRAMKLFEKAAPSDAYTRKGVEAVLKGMGLIADEH